MPWKASRRFSRSVPHRSTAADAEPRLALVIAHRGASAYEPENSLAAFRKARELGADGVELDIHLTADGIPIVHHDPEVDGRAIGETPAADLRRHRLANGEPVPRLDEALRTIGPELYAFVEVKALAPAHDEALLRALAAAPTQPRCHVHSFDHRIVKRLRRANADLTVGVLSCSYPLEPARQLHQAGAGELWQHHSLVDAALVGGVHARGGRLFVWTVDEPGEMRDLLRLGVDGICSNKPDVAREVVG